MKKIVASVFLVLISFTLTFCKTEKTLEGMYKGVLPCADCEGIDKVLILKKEGTFELTTTYLGKNNVEPIKEKGNYKVEGNQITLLSTPEYKFLYEKDFLELLDIDGNKIESELNYKLKKQI